jgi:hypothetical protein
VSGTGAGTGGLLAWAFVLVGLVVMTYGGMLRGWRRRARRHDLEALAPAGEPGQPLLQADGRYIGTTLAGDWLDRVVARGLGARSPARLVLSVEGLDVLRPGGSFRVPVAALEGARHDQGIAGKVVPPHGVLVVTWRHGDLRLDTGFRLDPSGQHATWVEQLDTITKEPA